MFSNAPVSAEAWIRCLFLTLPETRGNFAHELIGAAPSGRKFRMAASFEQAGPTAEVSAESAFKLAVIEKASGPSRMWLKSVGLPGGFPPPQRRLVALRN